MHKKQTDAITTIDIGNHRFEVRRPSNLDPVEALCESIRAVESYVAKKNKMMYDITEVVTDGKLYTVKHPVGLTNAERVVRSIKVVEKQKATKGIYSVPKSNKLYKSKLFYLLFILCLFIIML